MSETRRGVLVLEPFYGGSHKAFVDGLKRYSRHRVEALTLPDRFWKWRMRGAAILMAERMKSLRRPPDVILASDMLSVADLKALLGPAAPPILLYMHENQLPYPPPSLPEGGRGDLQFAFTNVTSCLAAEKVLFNSEFHGETFLKALPALFRMMPDCRPKGVPERIRKKSSVLPLGCDLAAFDSIRRPASRPGPPIILWNHRWEFDKAPEVFFEALFRLQADRLRFRVAVCGESHQANPKIFLEAKRRLRRRLVHFGFEPSRARYARLLSGSDIAVSTAIQENFGLSAVEAMYAGCYPLLPRRLSYPEILPAEFHAGHLYDGPEDLYARLSTLLREGATFDPERLQRRMAVYDWRAMARRYDDLFDGCGRAP